MLAVLKFCLWIYFVRRAETGAAPVQGCSGASGFRVYYGGRKNTNSIPLGSLYNYTIKTPKTLL